MNNLLYQAAQTHGTPAFVYFLDDVYARIALIRSAYDNHFGVSYAMKCNPHPFLLQILMPRVDTLDISSGGELALARKLHWPAHLISFTGPAKRPQDLRAAVDCNLGEVVLESPREAADLSAIAGAAGKKQGVLIRIAPKKLPKGFGVNMAGRPTQFGIDEEDLASAMDQILPLPNLHIRGFHIYSGTQCLKPDAIAENYEIFMEIFRHACSTWNIIPEKLVFGSGMGIPYHEGDLPIDPRAIAPRILPQLKQMKGDPRFARTQFLLETGRFLVGEAGIYVTRVISKKKSRGVTICMCDGGMNHHLGAAGHLGMVIHKPYRMFKVEPPSAAGALTGAPGDLHPVDLFGPLCTTIDVLGRNVKLPPMEIGDLLAIHCSGAYGPSASPNNFISHDLPKEIFIEGGQILLPANF